jgi:DNA-binding transcriptional MerR regulator
MAAELTIGEFSQISRLSVKTLRHYHEWGVLEPAAVDPDSGYRYYATDQVPTAQTIRRFRDLEMPIEQVKAILAAPDPASRDALIAAHLERMEQQLARTQEAVASLRGLLEGHRDTARVEYLDIPSQPALAITATIDRDGLEDWWRAAFAQLRAENATVTGPPSGFYAHELFEEEAGEATVYLPVDALPEHPGAMILPPRRLATLRHDGPHTDIDLAYGALGTHVAERGLGAPGPVHERYLVSVLDGAAPADWRTEIGWPIATEAGA